MWASAVLLLFLFALLFLLYRTMLDAKKKFQEKEQHEKLFSSVSNDDLYELKKHADKGILGVVQGDGYTVELKGKSARVFVYFLSQAVHEHQLSNVNVVANGQLGESNWRVTVFTDPHDLGCGNLKYHGFW